MLKMARDLRTVFPGRPIWLSEWSVGCGENAISIVGMADAYLGLFEHPELFAIADYFQINASHALIDYDKTTRTHTRTSYGAAYQIVRDVFENSEIFASETESTKIGGIDAVSAEAVIKDGKATVFAINKTTASVPLKIIVNGIAYSRPCTHRALSFDDLNRLKSFAMDESVLSEVQPQEGGIVLPPMSLNRIDDLSATK